MQKLPYTSFQRKIADILIFQTKEFNIDFLIFLCEILLSINFYFISDFFLVIEVIYNKLSQRIENLLNQFKNFCKDKNQISFDEVSFDSAFQILLQLLTIHLLIYFAKVFIYKTIEISQIFKIKFKCIFNYLIISFFLNFFQLFF